MKRFKTEYIEKYLIQGDFESNFISVKTDSDKDNKRRVLNTDGRYKLKDKKSFTWNGKI